jgi:molybdopterin-guanine dinucleotide biosynthesis protein A
MFDAGRERTHAGPAETGFTALVLAGTRPGGDQLARAAGVSHKALARVAGVSMLARVLGALRATAAVQRMVVCGIDRETLAMQPELQRLIEEVECVGSRATPSASVLAALDELDPCLPLLVATADHPLLTPALVDDFCARSAGSGADVTVGLVAAELVHRVFPAPRRTIMPFRDGAYCGCNLYAFLTAAARRAAAAWTEVERHRKRPWRIVGALGVGVTLRFLLRRLSVDAVTDLASERIGARVRPIFLSHPEAGFDVDTTAQLAAAEAFLQARAGQPRM